jgi:hypothetical protein
MAALSGVLCWLWLAFGLAAGAPQNAAGEQASALAEVDDQDLAAALTTLSGSADFLARFRERSAGCRLPLAWVTIARAGGEPEGTIRLRSGPYFSPVFHLTDGPLRVAIPYPAPYGEGHGTLVVMNAGAGSVVALLPPWHVNVRSGEMARAVNWVPTRRCPGSNG